MTANTKSRMTTKRPEPLPGISAEEWDALFQEPDQREARLTLAEVESAVQALPYRPDAEGRASVRVSDLLAAIEELRHED